MSCRTAQYVMCYYYTRSLVIGVLCTRTCICVYNIVGGGGGGGGISHVIMHVCIHVHVYAWCTLPFALLLHVA